MHADPVGVDHVPNLPRAEVLGVAVVPYRWVAVVHLKKPFAAQPDHVGRLDRPAEVGVVNVREHRLAGRLALRQHGVDVFLHRRRHPGPALRRDLFPDVGDVDVDRQALKLVGDFLALHQQETPRHGHLRAILGVSLEPDPRDALDDFVLDPVVAETFQIFVERTLAAGIFLAVNPALALGQHVVVGDAEKVVAVAAVPVGDHFGVVVAIAPERVGVEVALPPAGVLGGEG